MQSISVPALGQIVNSRTGESFSPQVSSGKSRPLASKCDVSLKEAVAQALRSTGYPSLRHVEIEICADVVVLWGQIPSYYQKQLAQSIAQHVEGVRGVANGLDVICSL